PGAHTLQSFALTPISEIAACSALRIVASRVFSCAPSRPSDLMAYCFKRNPPASLTSNSASLRLPAPKSTARNDLDCSIGCRYKSVSFELVRTRRDSPWWLSEKRNGVKYKNNFFAYFVRKFRSSPKNFLLTVEEIFALHPRADKSPLQKAAPLLHHRWG